MSTRDEYRALLEKFFRGLSSKNVDAVMACYAPGAKLEVVAPGPFEGEMVASREGLEAFFKVIAEIQFEFRGMIVDGNKVALEVKSTGRLANGKPYKNCYHDYFEIENGRISAFREYPTYPVPF